MVNTNWKIVLIIILITSGILLVMFEISREQEPPTAPEQELREFERFVVVVNATGVYPERINVPANELLLLTVSAQNGTYQFLLPEAGVAVYARAEKPARPVFELQPGEYVFSAYGQGVRHRGVIIASEQ